METRENILLRVTGSCASIEKNKTWLAAKKEEEEEEEWRAVLIKYYIVRG